MQDSGAPGQQHSSRACCSICSSTPQTLLGSCSDQQRLHTNTWHVVMMAPGNTPSLLPCPCALQNFFICGRTLPLWIVVIALLAQGLDSNATLGNVALSYK